MKDKDIAFRYKNIFKEYVSKLWVGDQLKNHIADEQFIDKNPTVYLYYPVMFFEAFDTAKNYQTQLDLLSIGGYLCFRSVMQNDTELDKHEVISEKFRFPIASRVCQEECVKILSNLFPLDSPFWGYWNQCKFDYLQAVNADKLYEGEDVSISKFEQIAEYKSAFAKVAIHSAFILSGSNQAIYHTDLLASHRLFSVGFQLLDDIDDFKKDFVEKQINYAHVALKRVFIEKKITWDEQDLPLLEKHLYVQGVAQELLSLAIEYFDKALVLVENISVPLWKDTLQAKRKEALSTKLRLIAYQKTLFAKARLSVTKPAKKRTLKEAIEDAKNYLLVNQEKDGSWEDFYHISGLSNTWTTGYILNCISTLSEPFELLSRQKACNFLINHRNNGLWGWNTDWISDTDSTTCVLSGLQSNNYPIGKELIIWQKLQQENGGFSTYTNKESVLWSVNHTNTDIGGWMQSHVCVSALAFYFMTQLKQNDSERASLKKYLLNNQSTDGLWHCYWWTSPIYATYYTLKSLAIENDLADKSIFDKGMFALLNLQQKDGSFSDAYSQSSPFYTAMVLDLLCTSPQLYQQYGTQADQTYQWLHDAQFEDGSVNPTAALQIPAPNVIDINSVSHWEKSNNATNHITDDFMRLFSTGQTLKAFDSYYQLTNDLRNTHS
jgi:hypothetical protein